MRVALAALLLLAACQRAPAPASDKAAAPPPAPAPAAPASGEVAAAERLVASRLGTSGERRFVEGRAHSRDRVAIVCGAYEQSGVRRRYIAVGTDRLLVEPRMRPGEMDRAYREYCGDGERG